jgi:hypothetical protein
MVKSLLTVCAAVAALCASPLLHAQSESESRAAPSKPATKAEKESAKQQRRATGKEVSVKDEGRLEEQPTTATTKKVSDEEKALAKAKRQAAGKEATKAGSGRLDDEGTKK